MKLSIRKSASYLQNKQNNVINVFTKTVEKLLKLNSQIDEELEKDLTDKEELIQEIKQIDSEIKQKESLKETNSKTINKIKSFLND